MDIVVWTDFSCDIFWQSLGILGYSDTINFQGIIFHNAMGPWMGPPSSTSKPHSFTNTGKYLLLTIPTSQLWSGLTGERNYFDTYTNPWTPSQTPLLKFNLQSHPWKNIQLMQIINKTSRKAAPRTCHRLLRCQVVITKICHYFYCHYCYCHYCNYYYCQNLIFWVL